MKYIISINCIMFATTSFATTVNIDWVSNGNTYDQTTCQTGGNFTLPAQNPTKYGHHFVGWHFDEITGTGSQNGTPTPTNPIYPTFMPFGNTFLRAVGDVADTYDPTTGLITRRIGVKVLDGTEDWIKSSSALLYYRFLLSGATAQWNAKTGKAPYCTHVQGTSSVPSGYNQCGFSSDFAFHIWDENMSANTFKQWLADQYANGTPVTVYYPLATPTTETLQ